MTRGDDLPCPWWCRREVGPFRREEVLLPSSTTQRRQDWPSSVTSAARLRRPCPPLMGQHGAVCVAAHRNFPAALRQSELRSGAMPPSGTSRRLFRDGCRPVRRGSGPEAFFSTSVPPAPTGIPPSPRNAPKLQDQYISVAKSFSLTAPRRAVLQDAAFHSRPPGPDRKEGGVLRFLARVSSQGHGSGSFLPRFRRHHVDAVADGGICCFAGW